MCRGKKEGKKVLTEKIEKQAVAIRTEAVKILIFVIVAVTVDPKLGINTESVDIYTDSIFTRAKVFVKNILA